MFSQNNALFPLTSGMVTCTADVELEGFNMKKYDQATCVLVFNGALATATGGHQILTVEAGSSDGASTTVHNFHYRASSGSAGAASGDVWSSTDTTASTLSITSGYAGKSLLVEIQGDELATASKTYEWVQIKIAANSASVGEVMGFAVLSNARYADMPMKTAVA